MDDSKSINEQITILLAAYKAARETPNQDPNASIAVDANYGALALSLLGRIQTDSVVKVQKTMFDPSGGIIGVGSISAQINGKQEHFAKLMIFEEKPIQVSLALPSAYRKSLTLEAVQALRGVCDEISTLIIASDHDMTAKAEDEASPVRRP